MNAVFFDLFPLSVFQDKILLSQDEKKELIDYIFKTENESPNTGKISKDDAWLGDTKGHEFLLKNSKFTKLEKLISEKIKLYTEMLDINSNKLDFYYQRSWATITKTDERIKPHAHVQSNISFAYYLHKPKNSGDLRFNIDPQNEFATGLFSGENIGLGLLKKVNLRNTSNADVNIHEDDIIIFPSKTRHSTIPNQSEKPRISISGDVTIMLKDSLGYEKIMPHYSNWQLLS
jgi:uncharacterized protein (TIGR02466 family)